MSTPAPDTQSAMPQTHHLSLPLNELQIRALNVGDLVYLSGEIVISAGMPTYQRMLAWMDQGKALPIELGGGALFHLGSYSRELDPATGAMEVVYMNPTTSTRFSDFMPRLIRGHGLRLLAWRQLVAVLRIGEERAWDHPSNRHCPVAGGTRLDIGVGRIWDPISDRHPDIG